MGRVRRRATAQKLPETKKPESGNGSNAPAALFSTKIFVQVVAVLVALLAGFFVQAYLRAPFTAHPKEATPFAEFVGGLAINQKLTNGIKIDMPAPESIVEDEAGNIYTSLMDGRIVRVAPSADGSLAEGDIETLTKIEFTKERSKTKSDAKVARPLGLRLMGDSLYVAEAYTGIYRVSLKTAQVDLLVSVNDVQPPMKFPDDLCLTNDGTKLYFSDASSVYTIDDIIYMSLEGRCGSRIFEYDIETKELIEVLNGLCFANGVELTNNDKNMIVAETFANRVRIVDRSTWKTKHIVYLRGFPDNVRANSRGTYWVAASGVANDDRFISKYPALRQLIGGLFPMEILLQSISQIEHNALYEMTDDGKILQSLHDTNGTLTVGLTQATELSDGRLALGSYRGQWLAILNKKDSTPIGA